MNNETKTVQVCAELVPVIKRLNQRIAYLQVCHKLSRNDAIKEAFKKAVDDFEPSSLSQQNLELPFQFKARIISTFKRVLNDYKARQKNTRDWTQANKLISELLEILE